MLQNKCGRCGHDINPEEVISHCWYCRRPMCDACWVDFGHCGHPQAQEVEQGKKSSKVVPRMSLDQKDRKGGRRGGSRA